MQVSCDDTSLKGLTPVECCLPARDGLYGAPFPGDAGIILQNTGHGAGDLREARKPCERLYGGRECFFYGEEMCT